MMSAVLLVALAAGSGDRPLAAQPLAVTGLDPALAVGLTEHLAQSFKRVRVLTPKDMITMLGIERQRELLGCADTGSSCLAELGNALGANGVLSGELLAVGKRVQLNLRVIDPNTGKQLASYSDQLGSVDEAFGGLERGAEQLETQLLDLWGERHSSVRTALTVVPLGLGIAAGVTGGVLVGLAYKTYSELTLANMPGTFGGNPDSAATDGKTFQTSGWVLIGVGIACLVAAAGVWLSGGSL
jgi:hypothetical protein